MATFPASLKINRSNFKESPADRVLRTKMEVGEAKTRRRSSNALRSVNMSLTLSEDELQTFDDFYEENDSLFFDIFYPRTQTTVRARFKSNPNYSLDETLWQVSAELEIRL